MLYNGAQKSVLSSDLTVACDAAFNTTIACPRNVIQYVTYPIQAVNWNTSWLEQLCTPGCTSSLADLSTAISTSCEGILVVDNHNWTFTDFMSHFRYKHDLICLADDGTGDFCLDVESRWNITAMVLANQATWPTYTNKCYYDISNGHWGYQTDVDGTCLDLFDFSFGNASDEAGATNMAAADYFITKSDPIDDDNYGWYEPLEFDEYPVEIQCSSCFLKKFNHGLENTWGDVWDNITAQVWANMQLNCGWENATISPVNDYTVDEQDDLYIQPDFIPITTNCPQTLDITGHLELSCQAASVYFNVSTAGIMHLNEGINCRRLVDTTLCAPPSCPITKVEIESNNIHVVQWVAGYTNFSLTQFFTWNPYMDGPLLANGDSICSGPPGGAYVPPLVRVSVSTNPTSTST
ncbi:hypothetical protein BJY04DRAFT_219343 [Aspergillus karnatakaensis]|uniref:uncharacterized protein n=1 Tax=Aspergillus karnatakaensis TaxID=1810916 RepID=UPI003CCDBD6A